MHFVQGHPEGATPRVQPLKTGLQIARFLFVKFYRDERGITKVNW